MTAIQDPYSFRNESLLCDATTNSILHVLV